MYPWMNSCLNKFHAEVASELCTGFRSGCCGPIFFTSNKTLLPQGFWSFVELQILSFVISISPMFNRKLSCVGLISIGHCLKHLMSLHCHKVGLLFLVRCGLSWESCHPLLVISLHFRCESYPLMLEALLELAMEWPRSPGSRQQRGESGGYKRHSIIFMLIIHYMYISIDYTCIYLGICVYAVWVRVNSKYHQKYTSRVF